MHEVKHGTNITTLNFQREYYRYISMFEKKLNLTVMHNVVNVTAMV